ncbi:hypothetical protein DPMN_121639 [Dreissena polymorpha]|uniref:Uncharacterized protein n=1 Tax=Dreissena polymorpha TaxID=45954 RepID=A0A9D4GMU7_DREPO|nr:hypothetical protein DPMN_121639 [Dreissena polymorpha]
MVVAILSITCLGIVVAILNTTRLPPLIMFEFILGFEGRSELINPSNNTREDEIEFKVSLLISDHVMNTQGSFIAIATTLTGNNGVPSTGHTSVGVLVTETERPELIISFLMETFLHTQKMSGYCVFPSV